MERINNQRLVNEEVMGVETRGEKTERRPRRRWKDEVEMMLEKHHFPELDELMRSKAFVYRNNWRVRLYDG